METGNSNYTFAIYTLKPKWSRPKSSFSRAVMRVALTMILVFSAILVSGLTHF
jgi:hypothetical protein